MVYPEHRRVKKRQIVRIRTIDSFLVRFSERFWELAPYARFRGSERFV
jgi:hypothetical protein